MPDKVLPGPVGADACVREAVCIHTRKIFDACRDKDCVEDLRLYPTMESQAVIDRAISVKPLSAELVYAYIDVEPVGFHRGFYTVDVRYFYRVVAQANLGVARPAEITGLAVYDKRVMLFGGESTAKSFSSDAPLEPNLGCSLPTAVVEAVNPMVLDMKLVEGTAPCCDTPRWELPPCLCGCFGSDLCFVGEGKRVYLTLGQFSLVRLEREVQLLVPVYDYCLPEKECDCGDCHRDPCDLFRCVSFPVEEFLPTSRPVDDPLSQLQSCCCK